MEVKIFFYLFIGSILWIIIIVYRRHYLLKKLRDYVKTERANKEKDLLNEIEKKSVIREDEMKSKKSRFNSWVKKVIAKSDILISHWEYEEARRLLISLLVDDENQLEANLRLWKIALKKDQFKQAEILFTKCLITNPRDSKVLSDLWFCFFKNWKYAEAIESYEYAIKLDPNHAWRYNNLWRVYFVSNDFEEAKSAFLKALKINSRDCEVLFMLAEIYIEMKKLDKAKEVYERILEIEPYNKEASDYIVKLESRGV